MTFRAFLRDLSRATFHRPTPTETQYQWDLVQAHREAEAARAEAATLRQQLDRLREPVAIDLIESQTRIDQAATELHLIAEGGPDRWRMSIPPRPGHDSELVIGTGLREGDQLVREVGRLRDLVIEILGRFDEPCRRTGWIGEKQITAWRLAAGPATYARGGVIPTAVRDA
ncbi:hypothetical protein [Actinomadura sp. DC4]|uniref:hypothetical protein n=1 Tax=Actinomadura sp. DC4 TaxID=3055069 RepID=UPI0025B259BA|nr:hypothetical protein [Actinomadura sp. DC4]MDN3356048.1 hypothetical protein [Actinomadura sp. DC4]